MSKVEVTYKQVGRNLNIKIEGEVLTKTGTREELAPLKEALAIYKEKPLAKNLKALKDLLKPKSVAKEKEKEMAKAEIKRVKRVAKTKKTENPKKEETIVEQLSAKIKRGEVSKEELETLKKMIGLQTEEASFEPKAKIGIKSRGEY